jgi:hypothetical protein
MPAPAAAYTTTTPSAPSLKKGHTLSERRLMIRRDGSLLITLVIAIRDSINSAINATLIQCLECNLLNDLIFTTMDTVKVTLLNSKIPQFLDNIPDITINYLDSPSAQLLLQGIPSSYSFTDIGKVLTTFNTGLALLQQLRWLIQHVTRGEMLACTIVITATGPKEKQFLQQSCLSAFSSTFRLEI